MSREIKRYQRALGIAMDALSEYADPEFYHAIWIMTDRPAGGFADDFQRKHGHPFYQRAMPGKLARQTMNRLAKRYGDLTYLSRE